MTLVLAELYIIFHAGSITLKSLAEQLIYLALAEFVGP
jgi:hypothetical protein